MGIFTNPNRRIEYTSNGEVRQEFSVVYLGRAIGGEPTINDEATDVRWFARHEIAELEMHPSVRGRINWHFEGDSDPYLG